MNSRSLQNGSVSVLCFSRRLCKLLTPLRGQAEAYEEPSRFSHNLTNVKSPRLSRSSAPHAPQGPQGCFILFTVRWPACPQHYGGIETLNLSAPASAWHCGNPATDSSLEHSQAVEHPVPRCRLMARLRASHQLQLHCYIFQDPLCSWFYLFLGILFVNTY